MVLNDTLSNAMSVILNAERTTKSDCSVYPSSKLIQNVLSILTDNHFVGEVRQEDDGKGGVGLLKVNLLGKINKCGTIRPRYSVTLDDYEKFEKRYLPARDFGILVVSTSKGLMTHKEAKQKGLGGRLLIYCY
ncbi:30S ribosomal protein S8 [Candidatus Woesearchaeota archaeon]|nr:30S ribosomal protein S8 [Candidatus Woesearchaeota archaeon]